MAANLTHFNTIQIRVEYNGQTINTITLPRPSDFTPQREMEYRAEYTTSTGRILADYIGWRYADLTLQWDMLPQDLLRALLSLNPLQKKYLIFTDASGLQQTEEFMITNHVSTGTRITDMDRNVIWKDVQMGVRFNVVH